MSTYPTTQNSLSRRAARSSGLAAALMAGALAAPTLASTIIPVPLSDRVAQAQLVAEASVVAIERRNSDVLEAGDRQIPHTFVTFSIENIVKGTYEGGDTITLRFLGGSNGNGRTTRVVGQPQFRVGDREILFVRDNGETMCPLVGWSQGRLRVIRDEVYDDAGFRVWVTPEGDVARDDSRVDVKHAGYPALAAKAEGAEGPRSFAPPSGSVLPNRAGMLAVLDAMKRSQPIAAQPPKAVRSVNIAEPFRGPSFSRARANQVNAGGTPSKRGS